MGAFFVHAPLAASWAPALPAAKASETVRTARPADLKSCIIGSPPVAFCGHGRTCSGHLDEDCTVPSLPRSPGHKGVYARLRGLCPAMTIKLWKPLLAR